MLIRNKKVSMACQCGYTESSFKELLDTGTYLGNVAQMLLEIDAKS